MPKCVFLELSAIGDAFPRRSDERLRFVISKKSTATSVQTTIKEAYSLKQSDTVQLRLQGTVVPIEDIVSNCIDYIDSGEEPWFDVIPGDGGVFVVKAEVTLTHCCTNITPPLTISTLQQITLLVSTSMRQQGDSRPSGEATSDTIKKKRNPKPRAKYINTLIKVRRIRFELTYSRLKQMYNVIQCVVRRTSRASYRGRTSKAPTCW